MSPAEAIVAFALAAALLTVTPGMDTALVLRTAAVQGVRPAALAAAGICIGLLVWGLAAAAGLSALLAASSFAYTVLKWAGAAYLVYLGIKLLLKPRDAFGVDQPARAGAGPFIQGLLSNLLNPKVGVFYVTFFPQFMPQGAAVGAYSLLFTAIYMVLGATWFAILITATVPLGRLLSRAAVVRALDRISGGLFIAFGVRLALAKAA